MAEINVTYEMIKEAELVLKDVVHHPPMQFSQTYTDICGQPVYLKPENLQKAGSYKIRGAFNKLRTLTPEEKKKGVLTASAGNHAQGLALAAKMTGIKATVFMPKTAPLAKVEATKGYGATVISTGNNFDETTREALAWQKEHQALFISPFNDDYIIAGQGTIAFEILHELPEVKTILVPIGGGGVISGISIAVKTSNPDVKIIGVQAAGSPALYNSFHKGVLSPVKTSDTIADGINIKEPVERTFNIIRKYVNDVVTVDDEEISEAMLYLLERSKLVVEPSGAVGLAALLNKRVIPEGPVVVLLSGGNVDIKMIDNIVQRGLVKSGRYLKFITMISDAPGGLYKLLGLLFESGASIINIEHDRLRSNLKIGQTEVEVSIETKNREHNEQIIAALTKSGYQVRII
jgi:threonine dehydratase